MSDRRKKIEQTLQAVGLAALLSGATYAFYTYWMSRNQNYQEHQKENTTTNSCPICLELMTSKCKTFNCRHSFHQKCINQWQSISETCPICRSPIN